MQGQPVNTPVDPSWGGSSGAKHCYDAVHYCANIFDADECCVLTSDVLAVANLLVAIVLGHT